MDNINKKKEADIDAALTDATIGVRDAVKDLNGMNYEDFTEGSDYASLAKRYNNMGKQAMKDTMGQASARTGGYANSYAVQAGQQAQNSFMEKLEDAARGLYDSQRQEKFDKVNMANAMYDRAYGEKQDYIANQNSEKEEYLNNLYTDFSLMNDEEFGDATWDYYRESFENLGLTEEDFDRHKGIVQNEKDQQAFAAEEKIEKDKKESLKKDIKTWSNFDWEDTRIPEGEQDSYYNEWKAGWKDNALDMDTVNAAIDEGKLSPNVLRSYECINGISLCAENLDNLAEAMATGGAYNLMPEVNKYVEAWISYDEYGFIKYLAELEAKYPDHPIVLEYTLDEHGSASYNTGGGGGSRVLMTR